MIPLFKVAMSDEAGDRVAEVLRSGRVEHGPAVSAFEDTLAARIGNPRVLATNSGTSALHLALDLLTRQHGGRSADGEVLSTPLTFEGTNWPILANGLRIRWVDVDPDTLTMDLDDLARKITPRTRAIMTVHWAGYLMDLDRLDRVLDDAQARLGFRPRVVEDCAQAWAARYRGRPLGNHGHLSVFSFGALKPLTCGSGGLLVLPDDDLHERGRRRRWFGINRGEDRATGEYDVADWGYRFYMNDVAAAIGLANLERVDELVERNRRNAAYFDRELAGIPGLRLTARFADHTPSCWVYPVLVADRPAFARRMHEAGIATSVISRRNDEHSCVASMREPLPGLDAVMPAVAYLPVGWWLSDTDRDHIVRTVRAGW
ncbi:DegT/DnrJ/EryC1/StrS family aminotransferase [Solwaraspora sp. WMMA2056]|uniref:DegT/DnrJ/EryC1/StrS family aminotransferase n=1 Tax=Solwaraspora sp. WMMA2056 TaxID=3015161 RepID=UPI00259B8FFF|nr:DegT/DnrJ/EryC1/StrS family aminotransferase [Solwaraspora sp. WMMA2056]WJK42560.1 DegT/DnrJ/EryC1/StrS family aminotransferase [Solwaraspora sp. WMMA2056]